MKAYVLLTTLCCFGLDHFVFPPGDGNIQVAIAPLVLGGLIAGAGSVISGAMGSKSQRDANKSNLELAKYQNQWNEQMYDRQKQDALDFWNQQNAYNSPASQMQRYEEAGLNKNLIYGQGSSGNATQANLPSAPTAAKMQVSPVDSPMIGFANAAQNAIQLMAAKQQVENMKINAESAKMDILNKAADNPGRVANSRIAQTNADIREEAKEDILREIRASGRLRDSQASYQEHLSSSERIDLENDLLRARVGLTQNQAKQAVAATAKLVQDKDYQSWEREVIQATGVKPGSSNWYSIVATLLQKVGMFDYIDKIIK